MKINFGEITVVELVF